MFSIVTFYLKIVSENMTLTNQSIIIHVKNIQRAMQCYKRRNISRRNKNHGTLAKKQLNFF